MNRKMQQVQRVHVQRHIDVHPLPHFAVRPVALGCLNTLLVYADDIGTADQSEERSPPVIPCPLGQSPITRCWCHIESRDDPAVAAAQPHMQFQACQPGVQHPDGVQHQPRC